MAGPGMINRLVANSTVLTEQVDGLHESQGLSVRVSEFPSIQEVGINQSKQIYNKLCNV